MPKRKCSICGKEIVSGDETVDYKQKKVHKACFEILMRQALKERNTLQKNTQKKKERSGNKTTQYSSRCTRGRSG